MFFSSVASLGLLYSAAIQIKGHRNDLLHLENKRWSIQLE
jgi:hypothetical protein